ncbi:DUF2182 domain-containing protein [Burkholderia sp. IDO3]|uniref:DUF2182 domain-containing protein n=1 Tax=Burkholderia sp. IDO3 TaxID=1705310 RepID=UPI000BBAAE0A|nr:DUF2182 domain-containing protein [Burkholderia sp. IDO3]AXK65795.1 DUF2182 domain-containing protein [Burkholderia sp. IDO3]PCD61638.1 hypothetical protein CN645_12815 [Burkholderia sp. IDO3]
MMRATKPAATGATDAGWRVFGTVLAGVFAVAVWAMLAQHASMDAMDAMGGMPVPGGRALSAGWARPCGWSAGRAFAAFVGMWGAMTVAMMLPVLAPVLWRYRQRIRAMTSARGAWLVAISGAGYFSVWMAVGAAVFPAGDALAVAARRLPSLAVAMPFAAGAVVLGAGVLQFSAWKARRLACCRHAPVAGCAGRPGAGAAWRHGVRAALRCGTCCGNLMVAALATGGMDLRVMAAVTVAIAAERLVPAGGERAVRAIVGGAAIGAGIMMVMCAAGLAQG